LGNFIRNFTNRDSGAIKRQQSGRDLIQPKEGCDDDRDGGNKLRK
jgi:hypothetical protein